MRIAVAAELSEIMSKLRGTKDTVAPPGSASRNQLELELPPRLAKSARAVLLERDVVIRGEHRFTKYAASHCGKSALHLGQVFLVGMFGPEPHTLFHLVL